MAHVTDIIFAGPSLSGRLASLRDAIRTRVAARRAYKRTLRELRSLNDRELADLGLNRSMLPRIALEASLNT